MSNLLLLSAAVMLVISLLLQTTTAFPSIETRSFQSFGPGSEGIPKGERGYQVLHKILGDLALASRPRYGKRSIGSLMTQGTWNGNNGVGNSRAAWSRNPMLASAILAAYEAELEGMMDSGSAAAASSSSSSTSSQSSPSSRYMTLEEAMDKRATEKV